MNNITLKGHFKIIGMLAFCLLSLSAVGQHPSALNENKKLLTRYFNEVINTKKLNRMSEFFSSDYIWHQMNGVDVRRSQDSAHVSTLRWMFNAIPDIQYAIDHVVADGDMIAVSTTVNGTAKSEMFGLPAGEKKVRFKQMFFFKVAGKKITEEWEVVDLAGINAQLAK